MPDDSTPRQVVHFGVFEVDLKAGELRKHGLKIRLQEQPFQVLQMLLERPGEVVLREEIQQTLWSNDTIVEFDHSINAAVKRLRQALGDDADRPLYVETVPRRGYRFIAPLNGASQVGAPALPASGPTDDKRASRLALRAPALVAVSAAVAVAALVVWLAHRRTTTPASLPEIRQRRLTANSSDDPVTGAALSPDGKYVAYSDQNGLHLELIETGETHTFSSPPSTKAETPSLGKAEGSGRESSLWNPVAWFPDGTKLLVNRAGGDRSSSIWVVSVLGGAWSELRDDAAAQSVSLDGSTIAFVSGSGPIGAREIWLMRSDGQDPRRLVAAESADGFDRVLWSPDGASITYRRLRQGPDKFEVRLESLGVKDARPAVLISSASFEDYLWLPDGRIVYTLAEPEPSEEDSNLWAVRVDRRGSPTSAPRRLTDWAGSRFCGLSASADGKRLALMKCSFQTNIYVGDLEDNGARLGTLHSLTRSVANNVPTAWTPDSQAVIFSSNRNGPNDIFEQRMDASAPEPIATGPDYKYGARLIPPGSSILYMVAPAIAQSGSASPLCIMRVSLSGGPSRLVYSAPGIIGYRCARQSSGSCILGERTADRRQLIFSALDPVKGRAAALTQYDVDPNLEYNWDLAPDGTRVAIEQVGGNRIEVLNLEDRTKREVTASAWTLFASLDWAADGNGFYVCSQSLKRATLLYVNIDGEAHVLWERDGAFQTWGVPSPDGRRLAVLGQTANSNLWLIENF
ncbi:MAG TPA: winged helix-turn-helix domain-containing protein [Terriglobia bacterium]|nr:winged helix-turn-helix domain-containing protein [Terriglobia bacterium]